MTTPVPRLLFWAPRLLCILFAVFLSVFALDAFVQGPFAFLIHLFPSLLVALLLVVSWRREIIGAITFVALAILYIVWAWGRFRWPVYAGIAGPLLVMSALFLANWSLKRRGMPAGLLH